MISEIVALLMFVGPDIKEHRIQKSMSVCLKHKREATRQVKANIDYKCIKSKATLETNIDGSKSIKSLILELCIVYCGCVIISGSCSPMRYGTQKKKPQNMLTGETLKRKINGKLSYMIKNIINNYGYNI